MDRATDTVELSPGAPRNEPQLPAGTRLASRYSIVRHLGSGGSAVVYEAVDLEIRQPIALKLLRPDRQTDGSLRRLRRELAVARNLTTPRLNRIYDIGQSEYGPFLTMELCTGRTLRDRITDAPLEIEEAIRITADVLEALDAIHSAGILHRDVKPGNVLFDASGATKLADFGLALDLAGDASRLTQTDALVGTLEYLSPEQATGREPDVRSDLYSVGVLLFEMLAGKLPFESNSSIGALLVRVYKKAPDVRRLRAAVPRWLARFTARLLATERSDRYATAADALRQLRSRRVRWMPRTRRVLAAAAAAVVIAAAATGAWTYRESRFDHVMRDGRTLVGLDRGGRVLWRTPFSPDESANAAVFATLNLNGKTAISLLNELPQKGTGRIHALELLIAQTGTIFRKTRLPSYAFGAFSDDFFPSEALAADLNGDGSDEIAVSYNHHLYYPSYTVVYDAKSNTSRIIFVAAGQHHVVGAADVDGDGLKELLLEGTANRLGWYNGLAAVSSSAPLISTTPDGEMLTEYRALRWYALLPPGAGSANVSIDGAHRQILVRYGDSRLVTVSFDGFTTTSTLSPRLRNSERTEAYAELREARRRLADNPTEAVDHANLAIRHARAAQDPILEEWASRVRISTLLAAGKTDEALQDARTLMRGALAPSDLAYDVARDLHLRGQLDAAAQWYLDGLAVAHDYDYGRLKHEFIEGAVLALGERGRWADGDAAIDRYFQQYPSPNPLVLAMREYIAWRTGRPTQPLDHPAEIDFGRYVDLEVELANGGDAQLLLSKWEAAEAAMSSLRGPMLSLKSVLLEKSGRRAEAQQAAREALETARTERSSDVETRALFDVVEKRAAEIARAGRG